MVGLKDVRVLQLARYGPKVELMIEQAVSDVSCPACGGAALVKDRPVVTYTDLPAYGPRCAWPGRSPRCPKMTWALQGHRIAAENCLLTTRAAEWVTEQVGTGRTVSEVASELGCDWHTVNDALATYRGAQQPGQEDQAHCVRFRELRQLPDPSPALRRQAELAGARLDRRPMRRCAPARIRRASFWWALEDSNLRPQPCEGCALTS